MVGTLEIEFKKPYGGDDRLVVSANGWSDGVGNVIHAMLAELDDSEPTLDMQKFTGRWDPDNLIISYEPYKTVKEVLQGKKP